MANALCGEKDLRDALPDAVGAVGVVDGRCGEPSVGVVGAEK